MFAGERRRRIEELGDFRIYYGDPESDEDYLRRVRQAHAIMIGGPASLPAEVMVQAETWKSFPSPDAGWRLTWTWVQLLPKGSRCAYRPGRPNRRWPSTRWR